MSSPDVRSDSSLTVAGGMVDRYRWVVLGAMVAGSWAMTLPALSLGLLLPAINESLHLSPLEEGWLGSSLRLGTVFLTVPAAVVLTRFRPLPLMLLSLAIAAVLAVAHGLAPIFAVLLLARLGLGIAYALRTPAVSVLSQQWFPLKEIPMVNGVMVGLNGVAEAVALGATPFILSATGSWRVTYYIYGVFAVAALVLWLAVGRRRAAPQEREQDVVQGRLPLGVLRRYPELWLVGLGSLGASFGWWAFAVFWPTYMLETHDIPLTRTGIVFSLVSIAIIPSALFLGMFADRLGGRRPILAVCGLAMVGGSFGMLFATEMWVLVPSALITGFSWGYMPIAFSLPYQLPGIKPREIAVGYAMVTTLLMAGGIIGPVAVGAIAEGTGSLFAALVVSSVTPIALTVTGLMLRSERRGRGVG